MTLKLRVTGVESQQIGAVAEHVFTEAGGSIGRAQGCTWCLPDPSRVISGTHAEIRYANGEYYLTDTSSNGTLINAVQMTKGDERPLRNGDVIRIGKFDILVESQAAAGDSVLPAATPAAPPPVPGAEGANQGATLDPLELLGGSQTPSSVELPPEGFDFASDKPQFDHSSPESMGFEPPAAIPDPSPAAPSGKGAQEIPERWDETGFTPSPESSPAPEPPITPRTPASDVSATGTIAQPAVPASPPTGDQQQSIEDLLRAAGVPPESVSAETYAVLGQIFAVVVQGLVDVLRARAHIKDEFRVTATRLKPVENNPLKFSINAQDAMHNLFGKNNPGYQSPVDAFKDSFEDIKAHQMAMISGMRAAYQKLLEYFDPEGLEAEFDKGLKRGMLGGVLNKTKYWDLYEDLYKHLEKDPDESFHRLFGHEFGRAYEEQMERLSKVRK